MRILVFDNYDSFTYNLVHMVESISPHQIDVFRNDEIEMSVVSDYDKIILSPGPGLPVESGLLLPLIKRYAPEKSILGVCLGHQAIAEAFGGRLFNMETVYHGVASNCVLTDKASPIFNNMPHQFEAGRYHSWAVDEANLPASFEITARDEQGIIMAMQHKTYDLQSVQFHPESVLTPLGKTIMENWLLM